jgi:hypothetical protein
LFAAVGTFSNGNTVPLTTSAVWSVIGSPGVAAISNAVGTQGRAQALSAGTVTVTATVGAIAGSTLLTVKLRPLSVDVTPSESSIGLGMTRQFTATVVYDGGATEDVTASSQWDLVFPTRGRVNQTGLYMALASGPNTVSASFPFQVGHADITAVAGLSHKQASATRLLDGRVLIAGGIDRDFNSTAAVEIFDPTTGTFSPAMSLDSVRGGHTATLLPDGRVLVAGGWSGAFYATATAEIFDPVSGTWSLTGSMKQGRGHHTATVVGAKVLFAAGYDGNLPVASAELFDPATGTFAYTGSLASARWEHSATLLGSGQVLIAGGYNGGAFTTGISMASAELYNPATGTFSPVGGLGTARYGHTATLLLTNSVLAAGGWNGSRLASAELFNPATGTWSATGNITLPVEGHAAALLPSGQVLVAGGGADGKFTAVYDPASGVFEPGPPMAYGRYRPAAVELNTGAVLLLGGYNTAEAGSEAADSAELRIGGAVLTGLTVDPSIRQLAHPSNFFYKAIGTFSDGSRGDVSKLVTWSATPSSVATVTSSGFATTVGLGTATIRATLGGVSFDATLVVK